MAGAPKGRQQRRQDGDAALYVKVQSSVIERLDAGAAALGIARGAYVDLLVSEMPVDKRGLPAWLADLAADQLPLDLNRRKSEPEPDAA